MKIYDLAQDLEAGMPCSPNHPGFNMALVRRHGDKVRVDGGSGANEIFTMGGHVGTHIDALCHASDHGVLFGGVDAIEASVGGRFSTMGAETIAPFFCRAVLFDVPKLLEVNHLPAGFGITKEILSKSSQLELRPGDVALIRTGWPQLWNNAAAYVGQAEGAPGITEDAALWLAERSIRAAGGDTIAFEQIPAGTGHSSMPVHRVLLVENGIHIIEVLNLEEMARDNVEELLFVLTPLKLKGATGSPVRPIGVV
jgi:hypothetical protein